jgi:homoserine kinase
METVRIKTPATVANLVCGFDVLGMCLHEPYDEMEIRRLRTKEVVIKSADGYQLPKDPALNTAGAPGFQRSQCCRCGGWRQPPAGQPVFEI